MNLQDVQTLMAAFAASGAAELVVEIDGARLELRQGGSQAPVPAPAPTAVPPMVAAPAPVPVAAPLAAPAPAAVAPAPAPTVAAPAALTVPAPVDGVFYRAANPGAPPFVRPGETVEAGHLLGVTEVMKMMAEVRSPAPGVVRAVLAENGAHVSAGQPLFELEVAPGAGG